MKKIEILFTQFMACYVIALEKSLKTLKMKIKDREKLYSLMEMNLKYEIKKYTENK